MLPSLPPLHPRETEKWRLSQRFCIWPDLGCVCIAARLGQETAAADPAGSTAAADPAGSAAPAGSTAAADPAGSTAAADSEAPAAPEGSSIRVKKIHSCWCNHGRTIWRLVALPPNGKPRHLIQMTQLPRMDTPSCQALFDELNDLAKSGCTIAHLRERMGQFQEHRQNAARARMGLPERAVKRSRTD